MAQPHVIYQAKPGSALEVNRDFYARLAQDTGALTLVERNSSFCTVKFIWYVYGQTKPRSVPNTIAGSVNRGLAGS